MLPASQQPQRRPARFGDEGKTVKYSFGETATVVYSPESKPQYTDTVLDKAAIALFTTKVAQAAGKCADIPLDTQPHGFHLSSGWPSVDT